MTSNMLIQDYSTTVMYFTLTCRAYGNVNYAASCHRDIFGVCKFRSTFFCVTCNYNQQYSGKFLLG